MSQDPPKRTRFRVPLVFRENARFGIHFGSERLQNESKSRLLTRYFSVQGPKNKLIWAPKAKGTLASRDLVTSKNLVITW